MHRTTRFGMLLALTLLLALGGPNLFAQAPDSQSGAPIRLGRVTFDPLAGEPALAQALRSTEKAGPNTFLLQFSGPVQEAWKVAAAQAGAHLYGYIPEHAFVARIDGAALPAVRALPFVRWVGLYHPAYRLDTALDSSHAAGSVTIVAQTLPDADLDALSQTIADWGGTMVSRSANAIAGYLHAALPGARLGDLAAQDAVLWVAPYVAPQLHNNTGGGQIMRANNVRESLGLFGAGQIVAVADSGLDVGDADTIHPDFQGRLVKAYCLGRPNPCDWSDPDAHGTHVAGSALGSGKASGSNPANHQYPATSYAGVAPEAKLVMQSIQSSNGSLEGIPLDAGDLMRQAYGDGARIHTDSWGGPTGGTQNSPQYGGYVDTSQQVDLAAWQQKDMLILFSAGNSGTDANRNGVVDTDSINAPGTAKNTMTVGASENLRASGGYNPGGPCSSWGDCWFDDFGANPLANDTPSDDANGMAAFSSRGPTDDGRIKPDIVAPGTNILSTRSHHPQAGTGWDEFNADYIFEGGTSMATPLTAGAAALAREWLVRVKGIANPSSALMKSVLINGAADMSPGQYGTGATREIPGQRPNNVAGWGRVDLAEALSPAAPRKIWLTDNTTGLATGGTATYRLNISASQAATAARKPVPIAHNRHFSATMTPNASVISPQADTQLLINGGFENATLTPWDTVSSPEIDTSIKHSGAQSVHLDSINFDDDIQQTVSFPADASAATIDFWYQLQTSETAPGFDGFCYGLWDTSGTFSYVEECGDFAVLGDTGWVHQTRPLTPDELASVAGQSVTFALYLITDSALPSEAWVDDAALSVTTSGGTDPSPTPVTPTPTTPPNQSGDPLRVTLAWTDYPGEPSAAKALVNDLDLEVIGPNGAHYSGNQGLYSSGQCLRAGTWDACNNVEGVIIPQAGAGIYTIIVHGAQVAQGGTQPFALVASGNQAQQSQRSSVFMPLMLRAS
ncbi:MAG TPA: S8 family serine peptidase [Roseiflexaceae bacterium]|nr:S8 family serine peptidase [Roseiflexaceae bacterium]